MGEGSGVGRRTTASALVVVCLLALGAVALAPYSWRLNRLTVWLYDFFRVDLPIAPVWMTPEDYGNLLNVALFVPVGLLLAWWLGPRWGWALPLSVALSVGIELVQRLPEVGRESSLADVACNVMGASVGVVLVAGGRSLRSPPRRPSAPAGSRGRTGGTIGPQ